MYAFPTEEVHKIHKLQEIPAKEEVDQAEYVFMQPIYARTYGALQTDKQCDNAGVVEKYVMNVLPEKVALFLSNRSSQSLSTLSDCGHSNCLFIRVHYR